MITHEDQMAIFSLISRSLEKNLECYVFGGTAMMFYGYKDETKDVDLLFEEEQSRKEFIRVLETLGFSETTPINIYIPEKLREKNVPMIFKREENRFDIFVKKILGTLLSPKMKEDLYAVHVFKKKFSLKVNVLRKEFIVLLNAVTERDRDFEDILTIIKKDKHFDWQYFIAEVIWQFKHGNKWVLLDVEKMMLELKKYVFIEKKYFEQIYNVRN